MAFPPTRKYYFFTIIFDKYWQLPAAKAPMRRVALPILTYAEYFLFIVPSYRTQLSLTIPSSISPEHGP